MSGHTPGPWAVDEPIESFHLFDCFRGDVETVRFIVARDDVIAITEAPYASDKHTRGDAERIDANARLIAAAPDLLQACVNLLSARANKGFVTVTADGHDPLAELAAAIAKATGGDS